MTNCERMIDAFKLGGDFHSRTALVSTFALFRTIFVLIITLFVVEHVP